MKKSWLGIVGGIVLVAATVSAACGVGSDVESEPITEPVETLTHECARDTEGDVGTIETIPGRDRVPSGFDPVNREDCTFGEPISALTPTSDPTVTPTSLVQTPTPLPLENATAIVPTTTTTIEPAETVPVAATPTVAPTETMTSGLRPCEVLPAPIPTPVAPGQPTPTPSPFLEIELRSVEASDDTITAVFWFGPGGYRSVTLDSDSPNLETFSSDGQYGEFLFTGASAGPHTLLAQGWGHRLEVEVFC